jgi:hypothetical protein
MGSRLAAAVTAGDGTWAWVFARGWPGRSCARGARVPAPVVLATPVTTDDLRQPGERIRPAATERVPTGIAKALAGTALAAARGLAGAAGAAAALCLVASRSTPASSARQAVRRDPAVPKRRVTVSKTWWSISRSSAPTWWMKRDVAASSMSCLRSPTRGPGPWMATSDDRA